MVNILKVYFLNHFEVYINLYKHIIVKKTMTNLENPYDKVMKSYDKYSKSYDMAYSLNRLFLLCWYDIGHEVLSFISFLFNLLHANVLFKILFI